jgi:thiol-disulfide isomerase/thioredoxin
MKSRSPAHDRRPGERDSGDSRRRSVRRWALLITAGVLILGAAAAVVVAGLEAGRARNAAARESAAASGSAAGTDASAALDRAADAVGFHKTVAANVGIVESMPADAQLTAPSRTLLAVGAQAPDFTLATSTGTRVRLSDLRNKVVLLEFFATWCPHCQAEVEHLVKLFRTLPPDQFAFLSVNADSEDAASVRAFDRYFDIPWPTLLDPGDPPGSFKRAGGAGPVTRAYGIALYPTFYIVDRAGKVAWRNDREQPDKLILMRLQDAAGT